MKDLKDYEKPSPFDGKLKTTSVTIQEKHFDYVKSKNLNLSKLVRDLIEDLIKSEKPKE